MEVDDRLRLIEYNVRYDQRNRGETQRPDTAT